MRARLILLLALVPARYSHGYLIVAALACYVLAKAGEFFDLRIFAMGEAVSGHTLKHRLAAVSVDQIFRMVRVRQPVAA